jgi:hypothetical protein
MTLYEIDSKISDLLEMIYEDAETNGGEIADDMAEELEGLEMERTVKIENIACYVKNLDAEAEAIKAEEKRLAERRKTAENKAVRLREYLALALHGEDVYSSARVKLSWRKSETVEIENVDDLPEDYRRIKTVVEADKTAIKQAIKAGEDIAGAFLMERRNLQIK